MRELRIELKNYEGRRDDLNTIAHLALKYDLTYDASCSPVLQVFDTVTDTLMLESDGTARVYVSGEEENLRSFLNELENWFNKF